MASLQQIKKRLTGTRNIRQMTEAMELVSATKMRKSQEAALSTRPYAFTALELLADVVEFLDSEEGQEHRAALSSVRLLRPGRINKTAFVLVAADRGLAGSFNSAVFRKFEQFLNRHNEKVSAGRHAFIAVGQKALEYVRRRGYGLEKEFVKFGDHASIGQISPLADFIVERYRAHAFDRVIIFSTHFYSALKQEVLQRQLLPIDFKRIRATVEEIIPETGRYSNLRKRIIESRPVKPAGYIIEPTPEAALDQLLPLLFKMQMYHLILEANASEHSARRFSMKNATDNAKELISGLTLEYNRSRQAAITKEVIEITSTTAAVRK